jgi:hypothetical protein
MAAGAIAAATDIAVATGIAADTQAVDIAAELEWRADTQAVDTAAELLPELGLAAAAM